MSDFNTSLLREKIIITFLDNDTDEPIIIRSNRVHLQLVKGKNIEQIVVRGQNMSDSLRMAAWTIDEHYKRGFSITSEDDWDYMWSKTVSKYGKEFNADKNWVAVYINGKSVYQAGKLPFVDIVEKCAMTNFEDYDDAINILEVAFKKLGKKVKIEHLVNVALNLTDNNKITRTSIIRRKSGNDNTMTFTASGGKVRNGRILRCMMAAANLLEIVNIVRLMKIHDNSIMTQSPISDKQYFASRLRKMQLIRAINKFERVYNVQYRPDKSNFIDGI